MEKKGAERFKEKKATGRFKWNADELDVRYILGFVDGFVKAGGYFSIEEFRLLAKEDDISDAQWQLELGKALNTFRKGYHFFYRDELVRICQYITLLINKKNWGINVIKAKRDYDFDSLHEKYFEVK